MDIRTAAKRALKGTKLAEVESLQAEVSRWQRKETIARNKLAAAREKLSRLAAELACAAIGIKPEERQ